MGKANNKKTKALGMSIGTASNRLRKMILFSLVCELKRDICYQCGGKIILVSDLSIEHKKPWLQADNPRESFFDLGNIAFSHLSCNSAAGAGLAHRPNKICFTPEERRVRTNKLKKTHPSRIPEARRQEYVKAKRTRPTWIRKNNGG